MGKKIGISLSFCVKDIASGRVDKDAVLIIIADTAASDEEWGKLMKLYSEGNWSEFPIKAVAIANQLRKQGKIWQPRLGNFFLQLLIELLVRPVRRPGKHWIN